MEEKNTVRLAHFYKENVVKELMAEGKFKNVNECPKLVKIVINAGLGQDKDNSSAMENALNDLTAITGQKAVYTTAKKSIANFKLREGQKVGAKVTLRGNKMYEFFDRLISVALPRVRDFNGVSPKGFDGKGNFTFGVKEQLIFPEIKYDKIDKIRGYDITIVTTAKSNEDAKLMLEKLGFPFAKR